MTTFHCDICNQDKTHPDDSCTTGYGENAEGQKVCFDCCGTRDREYMIETGSSVALPLYLTKTDNAWSVGNWPGTLRFRCGVPKKSQHNIAGTRYDVWFTGPDGKTWHGVQYGEWTQIVHCKRTKN